MAGAAVEQLGALDRVILGFGFVTVNTPAHVDSLFKCGNGFFAHIAMAIFAVHTGCDVRAMVKVNKVRYLIDRDPLDGFILLNKIVQFYQFSRPFIHGHWRLKILL